MVRGSAAGPPGGSAAPLGSSAAPRAARTACAAAPPALAISSAVPALRPLPEQILNQKDARAALESLPWLGHGSGFGFSIY